MTAVGEGGCPGRCRSSSCGVNQEKAGTEIGVKLTSCSGASGRWLPLVQQPIPRTHSHPHPVTPHPRTLGHRAWKFRSWAGWRTSLRALAHPPSPTSSLTARYYFPQVVSAALPVARTLTYHLGPSCAHRGVMVSSFLLNAWLGVSYPGAYRKHSGRGVWVAQSVKPQTLDFCPNHDLRVERQSPILGSARSMAPS